MFGHTEGKVIDALVMVEGGEKRGGVGGGIPGGSRIYPKSRIAPCSGRVALRSRPRTLAIPSFRFNEIVIELLFCEPFLAQNPEKGAPKTKSSRNDLARYIDIPPARGMVMRPATLPIAELTNVQALSSASPRLVGIVRFPIEVLGRICRFEAYQISVHVSWSASW